MSKPTGAKAKAERQMLVKLSPGFKFTNALRAAFTYVSFERRACLGLHFSFVLYWRKTVGTKAACRTLMKMNPGRKPVKKEGEENAVVGLRTSQAFVRVTRLC